MAVDLEKLNDSPHLLDVLIQMEDILDSFDIYVFRNWSKGEVKEGPVVRRYWFDFTVRYPIDDMPDPRGAMRLLKHGVRVDYNKATVVKEDGDEPEKPNFWDIKISIPKRLISDMNAAELNFYDDDVEVEDVQDAQDQGMNDETGFYKDDNASTPDGMNGDNGPDDEEMPQ